MTTSVDGDTPTGDEIDGRRHLSGHQYSANSSCCAASTQAMHITAVLLPCNNARGFGNTPSQHEKPDADSAIMCLKLHGGLASIKSVAACSHLSANCAASASRLCVHGRDLAAAANVPQTLSHLRRMEQAR